MNKEEFKVSDSAVKDGGREETVSDQRKAEIAESFRRSAGILSLEDEADLSRLGAREIFSILTSRGASNFLAINQMKMFPSPETVELIMELRSSCDVQDQAAIDFALFRLTHNPESSALAIKALRELGDPRAIKETQEYVIKSVTSDEVSRVLGDMPELEGSRYNLETLAAHASRGEIFVLNLNGGAIACLAVAKIRHDSDLYVGEIYTAEDLRRRGYGTAMMSYLLENHVVSSCYVVQKPSKMFSDRMLSDFGFELMAGMPGFWVWRRKL